MFVIEGVPSETTTWLYIHSEGGDGYQILRVDGVLLEDDLELGDVAGNQWVTDAQLSIQVAGWEGFGIATMGDAQGPVIVRDDLSVAMEGQITESGIVFFHEMLDDTILAVPSGKYYVIPGAFHSSEEVAWVLDAIERDDPSLSQLPFIELTAGDSEQIQVDYGLTLETIRTLFGPP